MAGEGTSYNDIDASKVLNKAGLLELSSQIKTYVDSAVENAGGGSSYTAGDGISIDANDVISLQVPANDMANLFFILLKNTIATTNITTLQNKLWKAPNNKNDAVDALLKGYIINAQSSITITQGDLGLSTNIVYLDLWAARNNQTYITSSVNIETQHTLASGRFYFYNNGLLVEWRHPVDIWSQIPLYTPDSTFSTLGAYLTTLSSRIPTPSTTDGTYMLKCVVSSGSPTYSWEGITVGGSY